MKQFRYEKHEIPELTEEYNEQGKRYYRTPEGNRYPSITTVLSVLGAESLQQWKYRVGEETAERVSKVAARRGTNFHDICDKYIRGEKDHLKGHMPDVIEYFKGARKYIDKMQVIHMNEKALWCDELGIAGRVDVIAEYAPNIIAITDFKTSSSEMMWAPDKKEKYFLQCYGYRRMFRERTGIDARFAALIVASEYGAEMHVDNLDKYQDKFIYTLNAYKAMEKEAYGNV